jgi:hypothetical protein
MAGRLQDCCRLCARLAGGPVPNCSGQTAFGGALFPVFLLVCMPHTVPRGMQHTSNSPTSVHQQQCQPGSALLYRGVTPWRNADPGSSSTAGAPEHEQVVLVGTEDPEARVTVAHPPVPPHLALLKDLRSTHTQHTGAPECLLAYNILGRGCTIANAHGAWELCFLQCVQDDRLPPSAK